MVMKPSDYFRVIGQLELLRALARRKAEPNQHAELLRSVLAAVPIKSIPHPLDSLLYRSRWNDKHRLFEHLSEVSYPIKTQYWTFPKGRVNQAGQSVLYAARCELGTIIELRAGLKQLFTLITIKARRENLLFFPIGILNREFTMDAENKAQLRLRDYLYSEMTKSVEDGDGDSYNSTIAIGNFFLGKEIHSPSNYLQPPAEIGGLIYPSVQSGKTSNVTTYNYAVVPHIFDSYFDVVEAKVYCLTDEGNRYQLNELNKTTSIGSDGTIHWQFDFAEMKHRISFGHTLDGVCPNVVGLEEYI